jgi:hypothetical protein
MPKRKLKIDMTMLELAFDSGFEEIAEYLDLQSGQVVMVERTSEEAENYEFSEHYLAIPRQDSRDGYEEMEQFIETVRDPHLKELLTVAIQGQGAFGRFKYAISRYPEERDRWYQFKDQQLQARIREWLDSEDIEAV